MCSRSMENVSKEEFIAQLYDSIVGPDEPGLTYDNAYRALSKVCNTRSVSVCGTFTQYGSSSDDHAIIARELMKSVNGGTDDPVKVSEWQAFWGRTSEEVLLLFRFCFVIVHDVCSLMKHGSLSSNFMKELSVRFGMWPLSVQMEKALKKIFFYLEASSKTGATSQSLIEAVEAVCAYFTS